MICWMSVVYTHFFLRSFHFANASRFCLCSFNTDWIVFVNLFKFHRVGINFHSESHGFWFCFHANQCFLYDELFPSIQELHEVILMFMRGHDAWQKTTLSYRSLAFEVHSWKNKQFNAILNWRDNDFDGLFSLLLLFLCFIVFLQSYGKASIHNMCASVSSTSVYFKHVIHFGTTTYQIISILYFNHFIALFRF